MGDQRQGGLDRWMTVVQAKAFLLILGVQKEFSEKGRKRGVLSCIKNAFLALRQKETAALQIVVKICLRSKTSLAPSSVLEPGRALAPSSNSRSL